MAGGGKTATSSSSVQIPPDVLARYNTVNAQAQDAASQPFQQYASNPAAFVAPVSATEQAGIQNINSAAGMAQPYYQNAAGLTMGGAGAVNPGELMTDKYMSPYMNNVFNTMVQAQNQQNAQQRSGLNAGAIQAGAFGGSRAGVAQANLAYQQNLANQQAQAGVLQQGYAQAQNVAQQQQGLGLSAAQQNLARQMQAGQQLAGIGAQAQASGLAGGQAQLAAGAVPRQAQQAGLQALYNQFQQERSYPFQIAQFLANIAMGTGALSGSSTSATQPLGLFAARGGRIGRAGGGLIPSSMGGAVHDWDFGGSFADGGATEIARAPVQSETYRGHPAYEIAAPVSSRPMSDAPVYDFGGVNQSLGMGASMFPAVQFSRPSAEQMQSDFSLIDPAAMGLLAQRLAAAPQNKPNPLDFATPNVGGWASGYYGADGGFSGSGQTGFGSSNAPDGQAFAVGGGVGSGLPYGARSYVPDANLPVAKLQTPQMPQGKPAGLMPSPIDLFYNVKAIQGLYGLGRSAVEGIGDLAERGARGRADGGEVDSDAPSSVEMIEVPTQQFFPTQPGIPSLKTAGAGGSGGGGGLMSGIRGLAGNLGAIKMLGGMLPFADGGEVRSGYQDGGVPHAWMPPNDAPWQPSAVFLPARVLRREDDALRRQYRGLIDGDDENVPLVANDMPHVGLPVSDVGPREAMPSAPSAASHVGYPTPREQLAGAWEPDEGATRVPAQGDYDIRPATVGGVIPPEPEGRAYEDVMAGLRRDAPPSPPAPPVAPSPGLSPMAAARDIPSLSAVPATPDGLMGGVAAPARPEGASAGLVPPAAVAGAADAKGSPDWMGRNQNWLVPLLTGLQGMRGARGILGALIGGGAAAAAGYEGTQSAMANRAKSAAETEAIPQRVDIDRQRVQLEAIAKNMAVLENLKQLAASYTAQGQPIPETLKANIAALTDRLAGSVQAVGGAGDGAARVVSGAVSEPGDVFSRMIGIESGGRQLGADGTPLRSMPNNPDSPVGIAQVRPSTGPEAARLAGVAWDPARLANDEAYNRALGEAYYNEQVLTFGNPMMGAAAYNAGPGSVRRAMEVANQRGGSYLDYLPAETQRYVANLSGARPPAQPNAAPAQPGVTPAAAPEQQFFAQLNPDYNPHELMRRANATRAFNPAEADRLRDRAMAVQSDIETKGYGIGPDGKQIQFPGWQDAQTAKRLAETNPKMFDAEATQYSGRREVFNGIENIARILETYEPGMFAQEKANIAKSLESIGVNVPPTAMENASSFDAFVKSQMRDVFNRLSQLGGQPHVAEMEGLKRAGNDPSMAPVANQKVLGDAIGILRYADKRYNDMVAGRDNPEYQTGGVFDLSKFEKVWSAKPENKLRSFVDEATKTAAVRGATPSDPSKLVPGQAYILDRARVPGLPGTEPTRKATFVRMDDEGRPVFNFQ